MAFLKKRDAKLDAEYQEKLAKRTGLAVVKVEGEIDYENTLLYLMRRIDYLEHQILLLENKG